MKIGLFRVLLGLLLVGGVPLTAVAQTDITIGVHNHYGNGDGEGWRRLGVQLSREMGDKRIEFLLLGHDEIEEALEQHRLDFLLTDPAIYIQLRERNLLTRAVATVTGSHKGRSVPALAGTIVVMAPRADLNTLQDLRGKRVLAEGRDELVSYQAQAHMLLRAGIDISELTIVEGGGWDESRLVHALLAGEADAAFIGPGVLEALIAGGLVQAGTVRALNRQDYPGYPFEVSTRLYPGRPLVMLPHVAPDVGQELVAALYRIERGSPILAHAGIHQVQLAADYSAVASLARDLRLPPFDTTAEIAIADIWQRYMVQITLAVSAFSFILLLAVGLIFTNRRLQREIAGREEAETSLRRSQKNLADAQKIAHLGNWVYDLRSGRLSWSDEVFAICELDPVAPPPSYAQFLQMVHPDDRTRFDEVYRRAQQRGEPFNLEHRLLLEGAVVKYVHARGETLQDAEGRPLSTVGILLDITELKVAEQRLAAANERFELAMSAANDGLWDWDLATNHVYYSPRWKSMLGYRDEELENHFSIWETMISPEDGPVVMGLIQQCLAGEREGFEAEFQMRHKAGGWRDILSRGVAVRNAEGEVIRFVGTHVDISEHKGLERALRAQERELVAIIEHLPHILFVKEAKGLRYVRFNQSGARMLGMEQEAFIGKCDYDLFPAENAARFIQDDRLALRSQVPVEVEEEVKTPYGRRNMRTLKVAIRDETGEPLYLLGIAEDITDRRTAMAERERLQRELQQAQKMESLGQLTGGIAHDFNNLLAIINGYAGLALDNCTARGEEKVADYMRHLKGASDRATHLVAQMLAFSRSEPSADAPIQLGPLVKEDLKMLRATLPSTIEIRSEVTPGLMPVMMNPTQLHQILMNLAINARDAMQGEGTLGVRLGWARGLDTVSPISHRPVRGDWVELSVSDTGCGMDEEIAQRIFNPFFTTKEVGKGTGMGLAVVYGIMENHHGHILLESAPGKGSTFRMLFPPHLAAEGVAAALAEDERRGPTRGDGSEILVVDDELSLGIFMSEMLNENGYRATLVSDSVAALALFREAPGRFRMLITDQTMPNMTGMELIAEIRKIAPEFPVALVTGYSDKIDAQGASALEIPYFGKPVNVNALLAKVAELLPRE